MRIEQDYRISEPPVSASNAVVIPRDDELRDDKVLSQLSLDVYLLGLSRREVPNWIAGRLYALEGRILNPDGTPFVAEDETIDEAFNNEGTFRWVSDFLTWRRRPPRQKPQDRVLPRLRLIATSVQIEEIAPSIPFMGKLRADGMSMRRRHFFEHGPEVRRQSASVNKIKAALSKRERIRAARKSALNSLKVLVGMSPFAARVKLFWAAVKRLSS